MNEYTCVQCGNSWKNDGEASVECPYCGFKNEKNNIKKKH